MDKQKTVSEKVVQRGLRYGKKFGLPIIIAIVFAIVSSIITVIGPDKLSEMTNVITQGIMTGIDLEKVQAIAISLAILYGIAALMGYGQGFIVATVSQRYVERLRHAVAEKMDRLPLKYFDSRSTGDILSIITNDLDTVGQSLNQSLGTLVSSVVLLIGVLFMMFKTNAVMSLTAILSVLIGFVGMFFIMSKSRVHFKNQQANLADVNGFIEEAYSGLSIVNSYNAGQQMTANFDRLNEKLYSSAWRSQFLSGIMMPLMIFIGNFGYVMVCIVGAVLVIKGHISIGVIVAFMMYVRLFSQPLSQIAQAAQSLQSAQAALGRVMDYLDAEEMEAETDKTIQLSQVKGNVEFEDVSFGYDADKTIIHNFSAQAAAGQKVAIVGPTGAGKTTIVNLLMRFYEVTKGRILIDGIDTRDMTREELHDEFSMVLQDTWLFEGTIRDNLVFNQVGVSQEEVEKAAKAVGIHHFIKTLPKGYDTVLDDTVTLSVGQKQLMTIARALLKDSPLLILDEATSSVDTRTEELIQKAMDTLMKGRTSFVIAHRLSTIRNADLILVMKEGNIIEQGNHEALMSVNGFYADLYNSQFENGSFDEDAM
ncbi:MULTISPECIES: ABC transporter ATP-binding protein [unclassified Facklamia]|uniref:ABC transporter ATP-binding protein n=1 Tax=Aerococcaceae TaxID=186827 RepID=UPI0013BDAB5B|nr:MULTISPECIES: ABC transporter ATP-binding protein [unclassified Facklamia]NEW64130.1 ATP-binding cassette domain-containing protein [Facklamia sp. 252]NEW67587.1 ATP-binding cassette domain-containing protein [Facklamia sp. 253]QQD65836.1 ABC transporter ATP-binding protein [Aerococcaceae bacterium zg-252]